MVSQSPPSVSVLKGRGGRVPALICGADRPTRHPMDQQLVARLQALQRIVIFRQLVRFALLATDDVGDQIETHEFSNAHWRARLRLSRQTMRDLDVFCQRQIDLLLEELHDMYRDWYRDHERQGQ
eukprot:s1039_g27.t1